MGKLNLSDVDGVLPMGKLNLSNIDGVLPWVS